MLQCQPNRMDLRSMDFYIQILCRFQKSKQKVPPPSLLSNDKSPFATPKDEETEELVHSDFGNIGFTVKKILRESVNPVKKLLKELRLFAF